MQFGFDGLHEETTRMQLKTNCPNIAGMLVLPLLLLGGRGLTADDKSPVEKDKSPAEKNSSSVEKDRPPAGSVSSTPNPAAAQPVPDERNNTPPQLAPGDLGPLPALGVDSAAPLLGLNPEQRQRIRDLIQSARNDMQTLIAGIRQQAAAPGASSPPGGGLGAPSDIMRRMQLVTQDYRRRLDGILTPAQAQRLREVSLQVRGFAAVNDPDIADALRLTDEQRAKVAAAAEAQAAFQRDLAQAPRAVNRFERKDRRLAKRETKRRFNEQIAAILTPEQHDEFGRMQGPRLGLADLLLLQSNYAAGTGPSPTDPAAGEPAIDLGEPKVDLGEPAPAPAKPK
jgi:Spy/CpxP family protein refolding chaperone